MQETTFTHTAADGTEIFVRRWSGPVPARAAVTIAHGMGDHSARYERFAGALVDAGYIVFAHDHRGHGRTAPDPASLGRLGPDGWNRLVADMHALGERIDDETAGLPRIAFAHSMGSFALQQLLLDHSASLAGAVLCGTSAVDVLAAGVADAEGPADLSIFNAAIPEPRTESDWLSRDADEVDRYIADPFCGFGVDAEGLGHMAAAAPSLADPASLARIRDELPLLMIAGAADPINGQLALVELVAQRYRDAGLRAVETRWYVDARHELLNETNRDDVTADLLDWIARVLS